MIINNARGEVAIQINDKQYKLCLTLGALAGLETAFAAKSFNELGDKIKSLNANDIILILAILLEGGGNPISLDEFKNARLNIAHAAKAIADCFAEGF